MKATADIEWTYGGDGHWSLAMTGIGGMRFTLTLAWVWERDAGKWVWEVDGREPVPAESMNAAKAACEAAVGAR